jgi:DNA-binding CsgD family transcriptional regulator
MVPAMKPWERLTAREQKMLALLVEGLTNAEIGRRLGTTRGTIQNELREAYDKTGQSTRLELALWWLQRTEGGLKPEPAFAPQNVVESRKESAA